MDDPAGQRKERNEQLKDRTKAFALRVIKLVDSLPKTLAARTIGKQLIRCGTSVPANYRAACRARSNADFIAKLGVVEEETDESVFWMEMLVDADIIQPHLIEGLMDEGKQLTAIWASSINTARKGPRK